MQFCGSNLVDYTFCPHDLCISVLETYSYQVYWTSSQLASFPHWPVSCSQSSRLCLCMLCFRPAPLCLADVTYERIEGKRDRFYGE